MQPDDRGVNFRQFFAQINANIFKLLGEINSTNYIAPTSGITEKLMRNYVDQDL